MLLTRDAAAAKIKRSRTPGVGKLATATYVRLDEASGDYVVKYHDTDIVRLLATSPLGHPTYKLYAGDWQTHMTKDRINEYTGARIFTEAGFWYIGGSVFRDNTVVHDGKLLPEFVMKKEDLTEFKRKARALDRAIKRYCRGFVDSCIADKEIPQPGPGDCWPCHMVPVDKSNPKLEFMGFSHLIEHMVDEYYVGSLLVRALSERHNPAAWQTGDIQGDVATRVSKDWGYMMGDVSRGRETYYFYKTLRRYFGRRKFRLVEEFDPADFKKRYAEARKAEKSEE